MSVIKEGQSNGSSKDVKNNESDFQFYGGMIWKQIEYSSLYQYCYMPEEAALEEGSQYYLIDEESNDKVGLKSTYSYQ
jgi:hypothetical protein